MKDLTPEDLNHLEKMEALEAVYLRSAGPYGASGSSSSPSGWYRGRSPIIEAMPISGEFLDIGCAAGHLATSLVEWGGARALDLVPHGVDLSPALVERARRRLPEYRENFHVANAWLWEPPRTYDYVVVPVDILPPSQVEDFVNRYLTTVVAVGGRLIVSGYLSAPGDATQGEENPRDMLQSMGFRVDGENVGPPKERDGRWYCTRTVWLRNDGGGQVYRRAGGA